MSSQEDVPTDPTPEPDRFERFAVAVGDLDSPFYDEERDRDVWNEASAVGFQLMLWGIPLMMAVCLWVAGAAAIPYVAAMALPWCLASVVAVTYSQRRAVDPGNTEAVAGSPLRMRLFAVVMVGVGSGFLRAALQAGADPDVSSFLRGAAQGAGFAFIVVAAVAVVVAGRKALRRRQARAG